MARKRKGGGAVAGLSTIGTGTGVVGGLAVLGLFFTASPTKDEAPSPETPPAAEASAEPVSEPAPEPISAPAPEPSPEPEATPDTADTASAPASSAASPQPEPTPNAPDADAAAPEETSEPAEPNEPPSEGPETPDTTAALDALPLPLLSTAGPDAEARGEGEPAAAVEPADASRLSPPFDGFVTADAVIQLLKAESAYYAQAVEVAPGEWRIGYDHAGEVATEGASLTESEASALLADDVGVLEAIVRDTVNAPLNANEFSALVSLAQSLGAADAFAASPVVTALNGGDLAAAADAFLTSSAANEGDATLALRRERERSLFLTPVEDDAAEGDADANDGGEQAPGDAE